MVEAEDGFKECTPWWLTIGLFRFRLKMWVVVETFAFALGSGLGLGVGMGMMGLVVARREAMMCLVVLVLFLLAGMGCLAAHHTDDGQVHASMGFALAGTQV
jgi:hypothetical protein